MEVHLIDRPDFGRSMIYYDGNLEKEKIEEEH